MRATLLARSMQRVAPATLAVVIGASSCSMVGGGTSSSDAAEPPASTTAINVDDSASDGSDIVLPGLIVPETGAADTDLSFDGGADAVPLPSLPTAGTNGTDSSASNSDPEDASGGNNGADPGSGDGGPIPTLPSSGGSPDDDSGDDATPGGGIEATIPAAAGQMPVSMAAVRGGEAVLLVATETGQANTLRQVSLVVDAESQNGPTVPHTVDIDPVGVSVRYDTCCSDDLDNTDTHPLTAGSGPSTVAGSYPAVSVDGSMLAVTRHETVVVVELATNAAETVTMPSGWTPGRASWSIDGSMLAVEVASSESGRSAIAVVDTATMAVGNVLEPPAGSWSLPAFTSSGSIVVLATDGPTTHTTVIAVDPTDGRVGETASFGGIDGVIDLDYDASGTWLLVTDGAGHVHAFDGSNLTTLPGTGYTAASW